MSLKPPAPRPCQSCPYRRDVPSGVWAPEEYAKLIRFDSTDPVDLVYQGTFQCHQADKDSDTARMCGGWAAIHGADSIYLRLQVASGKLSPDDYDAMAYYESPVPLFASGREAAEHGMREVDCKGEAAERLIAKIGNTRSHIKFRDE